MSFDQQHQPAWYFVPPLLPQLPCLTPSLLALHTSSTLAVPAAQLAQGGDEVAELDCHAVAGIFRLLVLHAGGGLSVWDVR